MNTLAQILKAALELPPEAQDTLLNAIQNTDLKSVEWSQINL